MVGILIMLRVAHGGADDENRGLHAVLLQDGPGVFVVAQIAVVEGDDHGLVRQSLALVHIGGQLVRENSGVARLGQGGHVLLKKLGGDDDVVVALLVQVVVHEYRYLGGVILLLDVVCGDVDPEILGDVNGVIPKDPGQGHLTHTVAKMGLVVEVPGLKAHRAVGEVPIGDHLGQTGIEVRHLVPVEIVHVVGIHRGAQDQEVDPLLRAQVPDAGQGVQGAGDGVLVGGVAGLGVIGKDRVGRQILVHVPDGLGVPDDLVIRPRLGVEDVKGLGEVGVLGHGGELVQAVAGVHEEVFGQKGGGVFPGGLRGHGVGEGRVGEGVVVLGVVQVDVDH